MDSAPPISFQSFEQESGDIVTISLAEAVDFVLDMEYLEKVANLDDERDPHVLDSRLGTLDAVRFGAERRGYDGGEIRGSCTEWFEDCVFPSSGSTMVFCVHHCVTPITSSDRQLRTPSSATPCFTYLVKKKNSTPAPDFTCSVDWGLSSRWRP